VPRGKRKLYDQYLSSSIIEPKNQLPKKNIYLEERRDQMAHRYYYHTVLCEKRWDVVLKSLIREFNLGVNTIVKELYLRDDLLALLKDNATPPSALKKKYDFYNWTVS
jgi:hypothetical protein